MLLWFQFLQLLMKDPKFQHFVYMWKDDSSFSSFWWKTLSFNILCTCEKMIPVSPAFDERPWVSTFCVHVKRKLSFNLSFFLQFWKTWILMQLCINLLWIEIGRVDLMWPCVGEDEINYFTQLQYIFVELFSHGSLTCWKYRIILTASLHNPAGAWSSVFFSLSTHMHASIFAKACDLLNESCQQWIHSSSKPYHFSKWEILGPYMNPVSNESIPASYFSSWENCGP
jgi:hypothetical protein